MNKKKVAAIAAVILAVSVIFAGCGGSVSGNTAASSTNGNTIYGKVTAVDGQNITIALAENNVMQGGGQQPQGNHGTMPSGGQPQGSPGTMPSDGQQPQGSAPAMPSGSQQQMNGGTQGGPGGLTLTGESKTITVSDSTAITTGGKGPNTSAAKASLSEIKAGSVITVTMSGNTVVSITIMQFGGQDSAPETNSGAGSSPSGVVS